MFKKTLLTILTSVVISAVNGEVENKYQSEVQHVQEVGSLLYETVTLKNRFNLKSLQNHKEAKSLFNERKCSKLSYKAYIVNYKGIESVYFVASKTFSSPVIIGRHFSAPIENGLLKIEKLISSTKGCLNLGSTRNTTEGMIATSLDPFPNEFHVLQSKLHRITLYVSTEYGLWKIVSGQISLLELRE